jgi:preprotein translocase subunit YajC
MSQLLLPLVLLALMWVLLVRPQQQRVRRQRELIASLEVGDDVVTAGGIVGRIVALEGDEVRLEVAPGVTLRVVRLAVNSRVEVPALEEGEEDN